MEKGKIYIAIARVISKITHGFSYLIPKKKNVWIYGSWSGQNYSDNPKYMYEYMCDNHPEIRSVWLTRKKEIVNRLRNQGNMCYNRFSLKGIYYTFIAGAAFETAGNEDISPFINNKLTKTIMMWHGVGGKSSKWKGKEFGHRFTKFKYDYLPASSDLYIQIMSEAKNVPPERFCITGQARDDAFVRKPKSNCMERLKSERPESFFVIYMPTHRNFGKHANNIDINALLQVDNRLADNNMVMVIKPHFHELQFYIDVESKFSNIVIAKEEAWADPYEYLHYFDLMISDYSSCMYDFLCADKPIVLFTYDIQDFIENDANLHESFWEYPIGPMCNTWEDVISEIIRIRTVDNWKDKRSKCFHAFHKYNDGNNCERTFQWVKKLLESAQQ